MDRTNRARWVVVGAGAALAALFAALSRVDGLNENVGLFLSVMGAAFAAYVAALVALRRSAAPPTRRLLLYVLIVAAVCRAVLIPSQPAMSTDVYRYVWEGRIIAHGFNPFGHPPDAPQLRFLRDGDYDRVSHKHMVTIYPPLSQGLFALAAWAWADPRAQKLVFVLFDLGVILVIGALLRQRSQNPAAATVYAWNPLTIFEAGHSGHLDPVGIFFLVLGLWLIGRENKLRGFVAMGASFLAKYLSAVFIPFYLARRRYAAWVGVMVAVVVVGYLPFAGAGDGLFASLRVYGAQWRFNGLAYRALGGVIGDPQWTRRALMLAVSLVVIYNAIRQRDVLRFGFVAIGTGLLLAPTLYPWYVGWMIPFLCIFRNRAWILFTGLVLLSYWVWEIDRAGGAWELPWSLYALEYAPFYALLLFDAARGRRAKRAVAA
jgi:alpha-1,6-mannosyltransferase